MIRVSWSTRLVTRSDDGYVFSAISFCVETTDWVLVELGNFLAKSSIRNLFAAFVRDLPTDPRFEIIAADRDQFESGCALYDARPDKAWSLTDCISMVVLEQRSIRDVFTADHHFEQAGYKILLK